MSLRVLVLDRGRVAADSVAALLRFMGHQVHATTSTEKVLDEALAFRPDVALFDWSLPEAPQVCQCLALSGTRLVAIGAPADARRLDERTQAGLYRFLTSPCARRELSRVLASAEDDVLEYREAEKGGQEARAFLRRVERYNAYLARVVVFQLEGGARDGLELFGDRAARLYLAFCEIPLYGAFFACRRRVVRRGSITKGNRRYVEIIERHRYVVESATMSPDRILLIARPADRYEEPFPPFSPYSGYE